MEQRVSLITLGVGDLPRAVAFYEQIGWTVGNDWQAQEVAFFQCVGMILALWDHKELAKDSGSPSHLVPSQSRPSSRAATAASVERSRSVSSMRSRNLPPILRA